MSKLGSLVIGLVALGAIPTTVSACMVASPDTIRRLTDRIAEGRYFQDPDDPSLGYIYVDRRNDGVWDRRFEIHWDLSVFEDPFASQCAVSIPAHGAYDGYRLHKRDDGRYSIVARYFVQDPNQVDEVFQ